LYCSNCGTPFTTGLSFCNRCGADLRERTDSKQPTGAITALLIAITILGLGGLGIMLGGSLVLRNGAGLPYDLVAVFMLFTFLIVGMTEIMLIRNVSRLIGAAEKKPQLPSVQRPPLELYPPAASTYAEPIGSVTDNTTRTLEYARREK